MSPPYENFPGGDELDHDGAPVETPDPADIADADADGVRIETPDPADIADADTFEELAQDNQVFARTTPDQPTIDTSPDMPDVPEELTNDMEAGNTEAMPTVVVDHFPFASAGAPIHGMPHGNSVYESQRGTGGETIWSPFTSQCDWLFARWAKMCGPTSSAVTELLAIPEVWTSPCSPFDFRFTNLRCKIVDKLGLSYRTAQELNSIIDTELPGRPRFQCNVLDIGDERLEFYSRDILECIRSLYGDPSWAQDMAFAPERHYTSDARTSRIYSELYTSDWWWTVQVGYSFPDETMY